MKIGLDVGSTTLKCVVLGENDQILFSSYERHYSQIKEKTAALLAEIARQFPVEEAQISISGSAGMGMAAGCGIPFVQEVYATRVAVNHFMPGTEVVIELGGEDAKILFLTGGLEVRMNGSCAGGTGAFIDQMASLLDVESAEMNTLAKEKQKLYTIASRCGVFAKSDIQPLLNQGARKEDIAASIFAAVVNQTVAGLAQGRPIAGKVVYLGGPLTFFSELRAAFDTTLKTTGTCPENSLFYVAMGAALTVAQPQNLIAVKAAVEGYHPNAGYIACPALFEDEAAFKAFEARHAKNALPQNLCSGYTGKVFFGVDAGSTTIKCVMLDETSGIIASQYLPSEGRPMEAVKQFLEGFYKANPGAVIAGSAVTGYGEDMLKTAFQLDFGLVETMAHLKAAKALCPEVDFIIDIGGQDIKCFKIHAGALDNLFLNEACSSGCGSFLQTFAAAWGLETEKFANLGLFAPAPVDLGSRCTVFMNSSVKQAQKDGAAIENISAGLSISVVKNALYKVIRAVTPEALGKHIVVQGGTFLNNAVLRAFEQETGLEVVRPVQAGLMGAYGAALHAKENSTGKSTVLTAGALGAFTHSVQAITCQSCTNHCSLTVNTFPGGRMFIGGNRCERPVTPAYAAPRHNMFDYKLGLLKALAAKPGKRGKIGLPVVLNMYEQLPFWHTLLTELGFEVVTSPVGSTRSLYLKGQHTIPSDTVCYPAKLVHGHIEALLEAGVDTIFYPCQSYNFDEGKGDNHYNCPVVAYYPEVVHANVVTGKNVKFIYDYLGIHRKADFVKKLTALMERDFGKTPKSEVQQAVDKAYLAYSTYMAALQQKGKELLELARKENLPVIVLAGRPYHIDPEVNHGIDTLLCEQGMVVVSEDAVASEVEAFRVGVLNQWTYHARMYSAAKFCTRPENKNVNLIQLVSFGCGVDAVTADEVRAILENGGKLYTQLKIDEVTNLGAVKIRLRSLFAALEEGGTKGDAAS